MIKNKIFFTEKTGKYILPIPRNGFTINDVNTEFSETFFIEWTYPVEAPFTDELKRIFGDLENPNIIANTKPNEGFLNLEGEIYPGVIKFISCKNKILKYQFELGIESLPIFDRKLKDFDLEIIEPSNIYDYVNSVLNKKYPETKVCFPLIYTDKFNDKADDPSFTFKGAYNGMHGTEILRNEITTSGFQNRNILKPLVYLQHILKKGFEKAGYELKGDILTDSDFLYAALDHETEFFTTITQTAHKLATRVYKFTSNESGLYTRKVGKFKCFGTYNMSLITTKQWLKTLDFTAIWKDAAGVTQSQWLNFTEMPGHTLTTPVELFFTLPPFLQETEVTLIIEAQANVPYSGDYEHNLVGFLNTPNPSISSQYFPPLNRLDLNTILPDITFRDLLNCIKKWKNYKLTPKGGEIYMDLVTDDISNVKDLSFVDQKDVEIKFNTRKSYIIKFGAKEENGYKDFQYDADGLMLEEFNIPEYDSEVINIGGYPLPMDSGSLGTTAREYGTISGIALIRYEGLVAGSNKCVEMSGLSIPNIYNSRRKLWIKNRIEANSLQWTIVTNNPIARELKSHHKIGAYNNIHKIVNIIKKYIGDDMYMLELETENRF